MFANPQQNVEKFELNPGMKIADFGSGSGHYVFAAAKRVSGSGRVYAVDVQKDLLLKLKNEAQKLGLTNVETVWGDIETLGGTKLRDQSLDGVIASNILFQVEDKNGFCEEVKRVLKPQGKVYLIDWTDSFAGLGPQAKDIMTEIKARGIFENHGFKLEKTFSAGEHHYGLIFKKI